jgi:hypothetical protein
MEEMKKSHRFREQVSRGAGQGQRRGVILRNAHGAISAERRGAQRTPNIGGRNSRRLACALRENLQRRQGVNAIARIEMVLRRFH